MPERLITPSKITAWLECAHFLTLQNQVDAGLLRIDPQPMGSLAELLVEKGATHERNCLQDLMDRGRSVYQVPGRNPDESFVQWVERIGNPMERGYDVIYQMPFTHDGIRGIADFLVRVEDREEGYCGYEPIDAKLTRSEGKPGHVLQLCFYADALESLTGAPPRQMHLWLGTSLQESLLVEQFRPYWRRLRRQLVALLDQEATEVDTRPEPCDHCDYCDFNATCQSRLRSEDSLVYVANLRSGERRELEAAGVRTVVELATNHREVPEVHEENLERLTRQAALQVESRERPDETPAFELVTPGEDPVYGHGFDLMPTPDEGDVFFDFEGHPFWTPSSDLFFLSGLYYREAEAKGEWRYDARWAHDLDAQSDMIRRLVQFFAERRQRFPEMHVYHYNHTERSSLERLTRGTETESLFSSLDETGLFVDLYVVAKNAVRVGTESYGLKYLERLSGFHRRGGIEQGAGAVIEYEQYMTTQDQKLLDDIARYNEDDVAATMALRDWLVSQRPPDTPWRSALNEEDETSFDTDQLVERLKTFGENSPEHLLGDLLNYWRRERSANVMPKFAKAASDFADLYGDRDYIANLSFEGFEEGVSRGQPVKNAVLSWPEQAVDPLFADKKQMLGTGVGIEHDYCYVPEINLKSRELKIRWRERNELTGGIPSVLTIDDYVAPGEKPGVLVHLAEQVLAPSSQDPPSAVSMALLGREVPRFKDGSGPSGGTFTDDLEETLGWVGDLDGSFVAIQGPPGTGKTYSGSHIIHRLITEGRRVGITAMSHNAIDNLLAATHEIFVERGELDQLKALRFGVVKPVTGGLEGVRYLKSGGAAVENDSHNLIAGTTWLWARPGIRAYPVDVLVVDEAGQLALADAIASANGARNLILLGDPLQLSQVAQAEHPGGSGFSVLEHILGQHATIPDQRGVFISETRRMHPDVCRFISNQIYEGRLTSHESCARQTTEFGTGLRWLEVRHSGRSTESVEEADLVADQITRMLGTHWTDHHGEARPLVGEDFMVVAPYNDQVRLIQRRFALSHALGGVQVGTVDKFQGREAPVVFFTMTTSTGADMPRGPEFLFSRNRLNVAVSRARCLAYLVCTEELLNARARTIDEMRLIGTLSSFVDYAGSA
ncbi:MAG TPA: TM0106 family RecB-like putative nuclease [Acidimicrobiales bacterium]|nr:TM0106 family RecB-like putative nuclease [Acidimicrobiales bacterium]